MPTAPLLVSAALLPTMGPNYNRAIRVISLRVAWSVIRIWSEGLKEGGRGVGDFSMQFTPYFHLKRKKKKEIWLLFLICFTSNFLGIYTFS